MSGGGEGSGGVCESRASASPSSEASSASSASIVHVNGSELGGPCAQPTSETLHSTESGMPPQAGQLPGLLGELACPTGADALAQ